MSAFVAIGNRVRIPVSLFAFVALISLVGCKRDGDSYNFDDASDEAQQAIAGNVDFTLTEAIFRKWERAQANLDRLPEGELERSPDPGGADPVARGIRRLESNPRAKQAIESAGLSVRNFVLATVALAQAVRASQGGVPPTVGTIAANVRFVMAHAARLRTRGAASVWVPPAELSEEELAMREAMESDTANQDDEIATGEALATPTPQNPPVVIPPQEPTPRDTSSVRSDAPVEPPPKNDSLPVHTR